MTTDLANSYAEKVKRNKIKGVFAIIGCLLVDIAVGEFNLLSYLYPYLRTYFYYNDPGDQFPNLTLVPRYWLLAQIIGGPLGIAVYQYLGFKGTFLFFVFIFTAGQVGCSFITTYSYFLPLFSITGGIAQGGLIILPLYCGWRYFPPSYKTKISGILLSAYALAPMGTAYLALKLINPDNLPAEVKGDVTIYPKIIANNYPFFMKIFSGVCFIIGVIGVGLIVEPDEITPEEEGEYTKISNRTEQDNNVNASKDGTLSNGMQYTIDEDETTQQTNMAAPVNFVRTTIAPVKLIHFVNCFKDVVFLEVFLVMFIGYLLPHYLLFEFSDIGNQYLNDDEFVKIAGIAGAGFNALSRLVSGILYGIFGYKFCAYLIMLMEITTAILFIPCATTKPTFLAVVCYFFNTYGGQLGLYPLVSDVLFKDKGAMSYSIIYISFILSDQVVLFAKNNFTDTFGGMRNFLYALGFISCIGAYSIWRIDAKIRNKQLEKIN